jgi:hypothetical protein
MLRWLLAPVLTLLPAAAVAATPEQWVVVTAPAFREALAPLVAHRKAQGLRVVVVLTTDVLAPDALRKGDAGPLCEHVHRLCRDHKGTSYILLAGAVEGPADVVVPAGGGTAGRMKGRPTDNAYGCPGGGRLPSVAVGRFPARTAAELKGMVAKTLRYEADDRPGAWRRQMTVLAGIPAYNPVIDRLVEGLAMARFDHLDPAWNGRAVYSNPQSRFAVPPDRLHEQALRCVEGGQAFLLYLGHSGPQGLYGGQSAYLGRGDWSRLRIARGPGVFFTFGCYGCQLAGPDGEGYGVAAARNPGGPAAVLGSHDICFAAMVQLAADSLFERCFAGPLPGHLADAWLAVEKGIAGGKIDDLTFRLLDAVDGDSRIPQATQRQEHLEMFVLLGDPALRLPQVPADVELEAVAPVRPGGELQVRGRLPARLAGANVRLTLERTASSAPADLPPLPRGEGHDRAQLANYERANQFVLVRAEPVVKEGRFEASLQLPDRLPWPRVVLRAYAATDAAEGQAVRALPVRRAERP